MTDSVTGKDVQALSIDVSGATDLALKDKFGSLTIEGCDEQNCLHDVHYTFNIKNQGSANMMVTKADRDFNGDQGKLVDSVSPNPIPSGATVSLKEQFTIDVCTPGDFVMNFDVDAKPPNGEACQDDDTLRFGVDAAPTFAPTRSPTPAPTHSPIADPTAAPQPGPTPFPTAFPTNKQCSVEVTIECVTTEGADCSRLEAPQPRCSSGMDLDMLRLSYKSSSCSQSKSRKTNQFR